MFNNANVLITGGTGSFGYKFVSMILNDHNPQRVIVYSRDEMKQWRMASEFKQDERLRFFIGDVRDKDRLTRAFNNVDYVVHAAALKIVPIAEYNPFEHIKTNIIGAMNIIDAAIDQGVKRVVALSTDKACYPISLYGATKLVSDKSFISGNSYSGEHRTRFAVVRYGNVMGSRGSVIPLFLSKIRNKEKIPITDDRMTRFMMKLEDAVQLVWHALADSEGGEVYVHKIPSIKIIDLARAMDSKANFEIIGLRPGEKLHEMMISNDDAPYTYEYENYFKILPAIHEWSQEKFRIKGGKQVAPNFAYTSDTNNWWMTSKELFHWIQSEYPEFSV